VLREHVGPLLFALSALTSLLLLNYIAKQLTNLAGKGLPWTVVTEFLLLSIPFTVAMTLPMAVLVAVLYAFTRLASENEIAAMKANGVAMGSLLRPVAVGAAVLAVFMVFFNDQILPRANHRLATLSRDIARKKPTFALRENVLNEIIQGKGLALYANRIDRANNMMHHVHIYDISQPRIRNVHADSADIALTPDQNDLILKLYNGYVLDVDKESPVGMNRAYFAVNQMRVEGVGNELRRVEQDDIKGEREQNICDMTERYDSARVEFENVRYTLEERMRHVVRLAAAGDGMVIPAIEPPPVEPQTTWGSLYCSGIKAMARLLPGEDSVDYGMIGNTPPADEGLGASSLASAGSPEVQPPGVPTYGQLGPDSFTESFDSDLGLLGFRLDAGRRDMNRFAVEIHKKFALAGACIVFVLVGVPFALRFPRGGVGLVIGASLVIFAISYVGLIAGEGLSKSGKFSPFLAMWGANFVLTLAGIALILRMGKESTGRGTSLAGAIDEIREYFARRRLRRRSS
jgi:lipopolysaccharide export system permease protein